jgi:hypothetical protein
VGVEHGGFEVAVADEFLDGSDVSAVLREVGREGVTEGVGRDALVQVSRLARPRS